MKTCTQENCTYPVWGAGYCKSHQYLRDDLVRSVRKRSRTMEKIWPLYVAAVAAFLRPGDQCELNTEVCRGEATCVHHTRGRLGKLLMDQRWWKKSCAHCNNHVEIKDAEAHEAGLKLSHFEPNYKRTK